jgi:DNA helicase II / ATP-dependent DNA helicase PcrA
VLAVTFTNKAAEEMRSASAALIDVDAGRMWISTFHALCARLLRREAPAIGLSRDFVIYDSSDQVAAVKQILKRARHRRQAAAAAGGALAHQPGQEPDGGPRGLRGSWNLRDEQIGPVYERVPPRLARGATRSTSTTCC